MNEAQMLSEFRTKFRLDELLVAATPAWSWSVRPAQATLGCCVLSLNRHTAQFSEVTAAEMGEMAELLGKMERALQSAFAYDIINYLMLMMVDRHVHFHVIPRYANSREFAGLSWLDPGWPALPVLAEQQHADQVGVLASIREVLASS